MSAADGRLAWTGAVLGAVGLFLLNLVFGPIAIGLGTAALRRGSRRVAGLTSIALGTADLVVLAVLVANSAAHGGIVWHFGS
ncbi:MAG: hypothetical protein FWE35_25860 [Streptosporangiales bacterium]|nr:hypothetical protein [Streptosporangiales bacterium]